MLESSSAVRMTVRLQCEAAFLRHLLFQLFVLEISVKLRCAYISISVFVFL